MSNSMTRGTHWHVIIPIALGLLGCSESVPSDNNRPPPELGIREWPVVQSERVSVCQYSIGFPHGGSELTATDRMLLASAAQEAGNHSPSTIWLQSNPFLHERPAVEKERFTRIKAFLLSSQRNLTINQIEIPIGLDIRAPDPPPPDLYASYVAVLTCPPGDDTNHDQTRDDSLDMKVPVILGYNRFEVPLRLLSRSFWYDRPFKPVQITQLTFGFDWPNWGDTLPYSCHDENDRIILDCSKRRVFVAISPAGSDDRFEYQDITKTMPGEWRRLPATWHAMKLLVRSQGRTDQPRFEATGKNEHLIGGFCNLTSAGNEQTDSSPERMGRQMTRGDCQSDTFIVDSRLAVTIRFPGILLPQWEKLLLTVERKISMMKQKTEIQSSPSATGSQ
jgi:hypothetical protein